MSATLPNALFWIAAVLAIVGQIAILHSTFFAVPAARSAGTAPSDTSSGPQRALEALWAWLPAVGLVLVLFLTWRAVQSPAGVTWRLVVPEANEQPIVLPRASSQPVPVAPTAADVPATILPVPLAGSRGASSLSFTAANGHASALKRPEGA
ncbi:MAG TPA: hypothetical protein VKZ41_13060 [Gemmatimonadales bacterium]|nr:hypothetical protein [Gemmatimonadales bacterium]